MTKRQIERCIKIYDKNKSSYQKLTMMAFLFEGRKLISYGINSEKTDPIQYMYRKEIIPGNTYIDKRHAEIDCLKKFINDKNFNGNCMTLFILSKRKDGTFRDSRPCKICQQLINQLNINEICYIYKGRFVSEKKIKF